MVQGLLKLMEREMVASDSAPQMEGAEECSRMRQAPKFTSAIKSSDTWQQKRATELYVSARSMSFVSVKADRKANCPKWK